MKPIQVYEGDGNRPVAKKPQKKSDKSFYLNKGTLTENNCGYDFELQNNGCWVRVIEKWNDSWAPPRPFKIWHFKASDFITSPYVGVGPEKLHVFFFTRKTIREFVRKYCQ